jgi:enoyl-CoA hydratase
MEMILTADPIDARRAYEVGLINQIVPSYQELMPAAQNMAERILACAPLSVQVSKEQACKGFNLPYAVGLSLRKLGRDIYRHQDYREGFQAFIEKRKPQWMGK